MSCPLECHDEKEVISKAALSLSLGGGGEEKEGGRRVINIAILVITKSKAKCNYNSPEIAQPSLQVLLVSGCMSHLLFMHETVQVPYILQATTSLQWWWVSGAQTPGSLGHRLLLFPALLRKYHDPSQSADTTFTLDFSQSSLLVYYNLKKRINRSWYQPWYTKEKLSNMRAMVIKMLRNICGMNMIG